MNELTDSQKASALAILRDLVRIDSTNTTRDDSNHRRSEERIINHLTAFCARLGMQIRLHEVWPGRANLTACWPDQSGSRSLALEAHADTVGAEGMTVDPFAAEVRDGRLWGRGACDAKGSLATFMAALEIAHQRSQRFADRIHLVATVGEETGCEGAAALMKTGFRVDACVVGEPTRCRLVTAHKGALWIRLAARGVPCHTSMPDRGRNAISAMARAVRFIDEDFGRRLAGPPHPLLGQPTIAVSLISGGQAVNIVAPHCEASIDCRFLPGQRHEDLVRQFENELKAALPADADAFELAEVRGYPAMEADPDGPFVRNLLAACRERTAQAAPEGVLYFADSGPFAQAAIQCVLFGPGDIAHAHTSAESLDLEQYHLAIETVLDWFDRHRDRSVLS
jgi:acetylornithine deacetylase/succinyl-diaminopimelate desuccinylase-like protein